MIHDSIVNHAMIRLIDIVISMSCFALVGNIFLSDHPFKNGPKIGCE